MREGKDARLKKKRDVDREEPGHKLLPVYGEMLLQICRDYPSLPCPRTLTMREIRFWYGGLRAELREHTKRKK